MDADSAQRRSSSPTRDCANGVENSTGGANVLRARTAPAHSGVVSQTDSLLAVAQRIDSGARIAAVTKCHDSTLVKIDPGSDTSSTQMFAVLAALRVAFPFATVTAVESASSGLLQFQILVHTDTEELRHARDVCRQYGSMRLLRALSTGFLIGGICAYGALLYAALINLEKVV